MNLSLIIPTVETPATRKSNEGVMLAKQMLHPETQLSVSFIDHGFESLDTIARVLYNGPGIIRAGLAAEAEGADGIFVNCVADPAVDALCELVHIPVLGGFRASMLAALGCGSKISIILPGKESLSGRRLLDDVIGRNPEFKDSICHVGFTGLDVLELHRQDVLLNTLVDFGRSTKKQYNSDCLVLGCTAMSYIAANLRQTLKEKGCSIAVVEPLSAGLKLLESFVTLNLSNSVADKVQNDMSKQL